MDFLMSSAWINWDPNPDVFIIPYLNHPLRWYGLLFVLGFMIGFVILVPILRRKLSETNAIFPRDISDWKMLVQQLKDAISSKNSTFQPVIARLDKKSRQDILELQNNNIPSAKLQEDILQALTHSQQDPNSKLSRPELEKLFNGSLNKLQDLCLGYVDHLVWFIVIGTVVGARLGHVFFYEWPYYKNNLFDIIKIWEGGLASHGGTLGVILAVLLYIKWTQKRFPEITFLGLLDMLTIPTAFVAVCIRLGNFVNQEILGTPSDLPWAIIFGHPADGSAPIPRHPVQLYEAAAYLATFLILYSIWKAKSSLLKPGFLTGLFFVLVFGSRFFLEFIKAPQSHIIDESFLQTGQYLSIPFILFGLALIFRPIKQEGEGLRAKG